MSTQNNITEVVTFRGIVQGVGFRPTVYRIAERLGMKGRVRNMGGVVQLVCTGSPEEIDAFVREICQRKPPMAKIEGVERKILNTTVFHEFSIGLSSADEDEIAIIPADIAVCDDCLREFYDPENPRYMHPFISCTNCGPRYSIMERLPYDRDTTTMDAFEMCEFCAGEYKDPASRRYHAQTISCHACGPQPLLRDSEDNGDGSLCLAQAQEDKENRPHCPPRKDNAIEDAVRILNSGGVLALKGVGGYYLACSPFDESAVQRLREIKHREQKPFAVMFRSVEQIREYCKVNAIEEETLRSPQRPIALLEQLPAGSGDNGDGSLCLAQAQQDNGDGSLCPAQAQDKENRPHCLAHCPPDWLPAIMSTPSVRITKTVFLRHGNRCGETGLAAAKEQQQLAVKPSAPKPLAPGVCNTSRFVGAFLPSFGLQYLLLDAVGPLVMTSANISELPLIADDGQMQGLIVCAQDNGQDDGDGSLCPAQAQDKENRPHRLAHCLDALHETEPIAGMLYNERRIAASLDDSVARVIDGTVQLTRRSKGYVPTPVYVQTAEKLKKETMIFAAGGHLKSAFALSKGPYSYLSRHIGDLESLESESLYRETFARMKTFFDIEPGLAVCDMHPRYFPTRFAEGLGLPLIRAQHHHAHIASVMAEHGLSAPVIGVSFDGTGYGTDGAVWGGEILICEGAEFERFSHLKYVDMIGGDASMRDAWKSAISHLGTVHLSAPRVQTDEPSPFGAFEIDLKEIAAYCERNNTLGGRDAERYAAEAALCAGVNTIKTSSMGRLFDAVCAMLGIHYENRYEGECAILLENAAQRAIEKALKGDSPTEQERLAFAFHKDVAQAILKQCRLARTGLRIGRVCLSGGVFQNKILMEETLRLLRGDGFTVYYNIHVPPNDGGIALGQNYIGMAHIPPP